MPWQKAAREAIKRAAYDNATRGLRHQGNIIQLLSSSNYREVISDVQKDKQMAGAQEYCIERKKKEKKRNRENGRRKADKEEAKKKSRPSMPIHKPIIVTPWLPKFPT